MEITVRYENQEKRLPAGVTALEALKAGGAADLKQVVAARVNGRVIDLSRPLEEDCEIGAVAAESADGLDVLRHSTAHLMAQAALLLATEPVEKVSGCVTYSQQILKEFNWDVDGYQYKGTGVDAERKGSGYSLI